MPWKIVKRGDKWAVVSPDGSGVKGLHDTRAKAIAQLRALYANVPEARRAGRRMTRR